MKNIVISANTSWYIYNFRINTIRTLTSLGFRVIVVAPRDVYSKKFESIGTKYIPIKIDQGGTNAVKDILTFFKFIYIYRKYNPNLLLNFTPKNNIYSTLAGNIFGIPAINNIAGLGILFIRESFASKIARFLYKFSQKRAEKIFFQNNEDRTLFLKNKMASVEKTELLPGSGVDLSRFSISPAKDDGVVRFLLIARMLFDKGIAQYVEAAKIFRKRYGDAVEFRLLGFLDVQNPSAVSREQMDSWVKEGIVSYLGVSDQVEKEIAVVDCIVLPSFYREGVPKSLLEAGAMGKPIVTTDSVGCRETVDDGVNGFLCEPRSTDSLVESLEKIISMSHYERLEMGKASRKKIEAEFDEKLVINKYINAIENIL